MTDKKGIKLKLTKTVVDALPKSDVEQFFYDDALKGFGVRVYPSGRKVYFLWYRPADSARQRRLNIGVHGAITLDEAKREAEKKRGIIAAGGDPAADRFEARKGLTVSDLCDVFLSDHAEPRLTPKTVAEYRRLIDRVIRPRLGSLKVRAVSARDVTRFHVALNKSPTSANRALSLLSKLFNLAEAWGHRDQNTNPVAGVRRYDEAHRERTLTRDEMRRLGNALNEAQTTGLPWRVNESGQHSRHLAKPESRFTLLDPIGLAVLRMLILTGARKSEVTELRWEHVDAERLTIALPRQKGKSRRPVPVAAEVFTLLEGVPRFEGSPWVFPRTGDTSRSISDRVVQSVWDRVRQHAGLEDVHLHDLRHTVGTWAAELGAQAFDIRDVLRHANVSMTSRYVNSRNDPVRQLQNTMGKAIAAALEGRAANPFMSGNNARQPATLKTKFSFLRKRNQKAII